MKAIFFDLETSDKEPIGQIINYSFIAVNEQLEPIGECSGDVRLSRLQFPSPDAILKNRVDVQALQASDAPSEPVAMQRIIDFVTSIQGRDREPPVLIGFNSNRFDVPRLRTCMMRNGINPYFSGRIIYRDALYGVRKLSVSREDFPRPVKKDAEGGKKLSLSLEDVTRALGLLDGAQSHHSRDDVLLTIELARALRSRFDFDLLTYNPFEIQAEVLELGKSKVAQGLFWGLRPEYDLSSGEQAVKIPFVLLTANHRYVLLVDLEAYLDGKGRESIRWFNMSAGSFFSGGSLSETQVVEIGGKSETVGALSQRAKEEFAKVTLDNFFQKSTCDIEQDIYRVDSKGVAVLQRAIFQGDDRELKASKNRDLKVLWVRYRLRAAEELDTEGQGRLKSYALHRYTGQLQLLKQPRVKSLSNTVTAEVGGGGVEREKPPEGCHETLASYLKRINELEAVVDGSVTKEDKALLRSLREFYLTSEMAQIAGEELLGDSGLVSDQSGSGSQVVGI